MKCKAIRVAVVLIGVLALGGLMISCGTTPKNTEQGVAGGNTNASGTDRDSACDGTDMERKVQLAQTAINTALAADNELGGGRVKALVQKSSTGTYLEVLIEGAARGEDELEDLTRILRKFMRKQCVLTVRFVPAGTIPPAATTSAVANPAAATQAAPRTASLRGEEFEWIACEYPMVICPNGECCNPTTSNSNTAANSNSGNSNTNRGNLNANSSSNSNGNANR